MFYKTASVVLAEKISLADWKSIVIHADAKTDPNQLDLTAQFDVESSKFLYVRVRAISAYEAHGPNQNSDAFKEAELVKAYKTFIRRGVFINHKSDDPSRAIGIIIDAVWHPQGKYIECLLAIDKSEPIAQKIEAGLANTWSMGVSCGSCECSLCGKTARNETEFCEHLSNYLGQEIQGRKVFAFNSDLNFYELSNVSVPADPNAFTLEVLAAKKDDIPKSLLVIADLFRKRLESYQPNSNMEPVVKELQEKLDMLDNPSDTQILGKVRHKLKITASQTPKLGDETKQRVQSALDVGTRLDEMQKIANTENNPLEGLNVENTLTIKYLPGDSLANCYFIARKGKLQASVSASAILDENTKKHIEVSEKLNKSASGKSQLMADDAKPKPDNEMINGRDPAQPMDEVKRDMGSNLEMKDDSKPNPDNEMINGRDPIQPADVVKKYAQLVGAKSITFKRGENGSFTAVLSNGTITRLAALWGTEARIVREPRIANKVSDKAQEFISNKIKKLEDEGKAPNAAKGEAYGMAREKGYDVPEKRASLDKTARIAGNSPGWAREIAPLVQTDQRNDKLMRAWEPAKGPGKPSGNSGSEIKSYFQGLDSKNLADGGGEGWARKVNELTRVASKLESENKSLKLENNTLKKSLEAVRMAAVEEKKSGVISHLLGVMEKVGSIKVDANDLLDFQDQGLNHEQAQSKAYAAAFDRKKAELKSLDLRALETMAKNLNDFVPQIKTASKSFELPKIGRDEEVLDDAERLSKNWDK